MRQHRWTEYLEDYDFTLHYHHGKENVSNSALGLLYGHGILTIYENLLL